MENPFSAALSTLNSTQLSTQKCFSDGPSAAAPAVWSRLLHDEHGPELAHPRPPRPPGASPPRRPPPSPSPPTTTPTPPLALAPAAARGQHPVGTPPKTQICRILKRRLTPLAPPPLPPSPSWKKKHKSEDWPESWIRSNFRSTFPRNCDQVKFSNELWWLELKIEDWRVFNWTCDKKWDPASSRATYPPHSAQSMINGNTTSRSNYLDF